MALKDHIEQACRTHDIRGVIQMPDRKKVIVCPLPFHRHHNNTPSFSIFNRDGKQYWKCHGSCNREGDVVDLVGYLRVPGYDRKNPRLVAEALGLLDSRYEPTIVVIEKEPALAGSEWRDFLPPGTEAVEYARSRGLTVETMQKFKVGQSGQWMTMPCFEEGRLKGVKMRSLIPGVGMRYRSLKGGRQGLFNFDAMNLTLAPVLIVKAEIPCMLLDQLGFLACAPTGGEGGWMEPWRTALALSSRRIVVGDNDEPGIKLGQKRAEFLSAVLKFPPPAYKDIDEWVLAEPEKSLETLRKWMEET